MCSLFRMCKRVGWWHWLVEEQSKAEDNLSRSRQAAIWIEYEPPWLHGDQLDTDLDAHKQIKGFYLLMNPSAKLTGLEQAKIESDGYEGKWARTCFSFELICPKGWTPVSKRMHLVLTFLKEVVRNYRFYSVSFNKWVGPPSAISFYDFCFVSWQI